MSEQALSFKERFLPRGAVAETFAIWALCFAAIVVAWVTFTGAAKLVATLGFLYLPSLSMDRRGEDFREYGVTLRAWKQDLLLFLMLFALIVPLYTGGFWLWFHHVVPALPPGVRSMVSPFAAPPTFHFRLPDRFAEWVIDQYFVVALPEEFFYRGFMQTRFRDAWPQGPVVFGARLGRAWWLTCILFALGHLAIFEAWRLSVFFPALLFGWMREKTGTVVGAAMLHGSCNLLALVLQASFFGTN